MDRVFLSLLLIFFSGLSYDLVSQQQVEIIGIWGMFKDKHPDGWGSFDPPYEYLEFMENGEYTRTYVHKKSSSIIFGKYNLIGDSLVVFNESIGTDGIHKGKVSSDTSKLHSFENGVLELHEDWYTWIRKRERPWKHRKKYRRITSEEQQDLKLVTSRLIDAYSLIKDSEDGK